MKRGRLAVVCLVLAGTLAGCESASENAGSTSGPGVDVRCALKPKSRLNQPLLPGQGNATGVGSTDVKVNCAPSS